MFINNDPLLFSKENTKKIEQLRKATYVCDTEHNGIHVAIFYGDTTHPISNSRYFGLYYGDSLMITNGSFIEEQEIIGVVADNEEIIYSRHRHDFRYSSDGSVFVDGGRNYIRTNTPKQVILKVVDGKLINTTNLEELVENIIKLERK